MAKTCGIYRIAFGNGKSYIGQSVEMEYRFREHYRASHPEKYAHKNRRDINLPVHKAMAKYEHNLGYFFEVLETCPKEELDDREKYWIQYFHSSIYENGYNIGEGGQNKVGAKGEFHSQAKLTLQQVNEIKNQIVERKTTFREIAKKYNVSPSTITMINKGQIWVDNNNSYPLNKTVNCYDEVSKRTNMNNRPLTEEQVKKIRYLRNVEGKTLTEIKKQMKLSIGISAIGRVSRYMTYQDIK